MSLNFWKEYLFGFETFGFTDLIYARTACNAPKTKGNLKSCHITTLTLFLVCSWF